MYICLVNCAVDLDPLDSRTPGRPWMNIDVLYLYSIYICKHFSVLFRRISLAMKKGLGVGPSILTVQVDFQWSELVSLQPFYVLWPSSLVYSSSSKILFVPSNGFIIKSHKNGLQSSSWLLSFRECILSLDSILSPPFEYLIPFFSWPLRCS